MTMFLEVRAGGKKVTVNAEHIQTITPEGNGVVIRIQGISPGLSVDDSYDKVIESLKKLLQGV